MTSEVVIGVVGARDVVDRLMQLGADLEDCRLIGAPHREQSETYERLRRIEGSIDVALFTGPLQYDLARSAGEFTVPTTYIPTSASALSVALLRGVLTYQCDPTRVSIDSIPTNEVVAAYHEFDIDPTGLHIREYIDPASVDGFFQFHRALYRSGKVTAALTSASAVARRLQADGVPTLRMMPTDASLRSALRTAAMRGMGTRFQESQIAVAVVEFASPAKINSVEATSYSHQELNLAVHRVLLREAREMGATVRRRNDVSFIVHATHGALSRATENFSVAPFVGNIGSELGLRSHVGLGLGATAQEAEQNAVLGARQDRDAKAGGAVVILPDGVRLTLPVRRHYKHGSVPAGDTKSVELLQRIITSLNVVDDGPVLVDSDRVATALGVTARTARRTLQVLASQGYAWPMPSTGEAPGRPRRTFRLLTERLPEIGTSPSTTADPRGMATSGEERDP